MKYTPSGEICTIEVPLTPTPILHRWKNVPINREAFLGSWHRHVLHAKFGVELASNLIGSLDVDNRAIEFFALQREMNIGFDRVLRACTVAVVDAGGASALTTSDLPHVEGGCENLARSMVEYFLENDATKYLRDSIPRRVVFQVWCEISEDNECRSKYFQRGAYTE